MLPSLLGQLTEHRLGKVVTTLPAGVHKLVHLGKAHCTVHRNLVLTMSSGLGVSGFHDLLQILSDVFTSKSVQHVGRDEFGCTCGIVLQARRSHVQATDHVYVNGGTNR